MPTAPCSLAFQPHPYSSFNAKLRVCHLVCLLPPSPPILDRWAGCPLFPMRSLCLRVWVQGWIPKAQPVFQNQERTSTSKHLQYPPTSNLGSQANPEQKTIFEPKSCRGNKSIRFLEFPIFIKQSLWKTERTETLLKSTPYAPSLIPGFFPHYPSLPASCPVCFSYEMLWAPRL